MKQPNPYGRMEVMEELFGIEKEKQPIIVCKSVQQRSLSEFSRADGQSINKFFSNIEDYAIIKQYNDRQKCSLVRLYLGGLAKYYFNELDEAVQTDYVQLKQQLQQRFNREPPIIYCHLLKKMRQGPKETVRS